MLALAVLSLQLSVKQSPVRGSWKRMQKCKGVKASLLGPYLQLSPAGTSGNGMMTSGTSGARAKA